MKCKKHLSDLSSIAGVCASCLREKLLTLVEAQQDRRNCDSNPPRIAPPQSVSPYSSPRESVDAATCHLNRHYLTDQRFFRTPLVGPIGELISAGNEHAKKKKNYGVSLIYHMFRSKSDNLDSNSDDPCKATTSSSPSWISAILAGRWEKKNRSISLVEATIGARQRTRRNCDRGMSPARCSDEESGSCGNSSQSSPAWKQTPRRTPVVRGGGKSGFGRSAAGLTFCLSPLVRASPNRRWNQNGIPPDTGEIGVPAKSRFHNATSFCKNRSRKLADFGRSHHNH